MGDHDAGRPDDLEIVYWKKEWFQQSLVLLKFIIYRARRSENYVKPDKNGERRDYTKIQWATGFA